MEFRIATKDDLDECVKVVADGYKDYIYYNLFIKDEVKKYEFLKAIQKVSIDASFKNNKILLGLEDDEIVVVAQLEAPDDKEASFLYYALNGGVNVIKAGGIVNTLKWFEMFDKTGEVCHKMKDKHWYFTSLVVSSKYQGKGYGSKIIKEYVIPYVKEHGGGLLTLITNDEKNKSFYEKQGFEEFSEEWFEFNGTKMGNWGYKMNV